MATQAKPSPAPATLQIDTGFGTYAVQPGEVIAFPSGLPGFELCRSFVLVSSDELAPFSWLQSVDGPAASFLVIDPRRVLPDYRCALGQADLRRLGADKDSVLLWLVIVSLGDDHSTWVNLRAPIVINPGRMVGYQVLPHNSLYPLRHPLDPT